VVLITGFLIAGFVVGTPQPLSFAPSAPDFAMSPARRSRSGWYS